MFRVMRTSIPIQLSKGYWPQARVPYITYFFRLMKNGKDQMKYWWKVKRGGKQRVRSCSQQLAYYERRYVTMPSGFPISPIFLLGIDLQPVCPFSNRMYPLFRSVVLPVLFPLRRKLTIRDTKKDFSLSARQRVGGKAHKIFRTTDLLLQYPHSRHLT